MADLAQNIIMDMEERIIKIREKLKESKKEGDNDKMLYHRGQVAILSILIRKWKSSAY